MSARRQLRVRIVSSCCAYVRGYGARQLLTELRGRVPMYSTSRAAWVVQERTARDLIAIAESRGYSIVLEGGESDG